MRGKVFKFDNNRKAAELIDEITKTIYLIDKKVLEKAEITNLEIGQEIIFVSGNPAGNGRFRVSKIVTEETVSQEDLFEKMSLPEKESISGYLPFSNPYNFVPVENPKKIEKFIKPFVAHDKFDGLSGIISCRLRTLSPFFIAGTHEDDTRGKHKELDFFSIDKKKNNGQENNWQMPIVPGSALRGVIRSVCEAVSNSSFTALNSEFLDYRLDSKKSRFLKCGIVQKIATSSENGEIKELNKANLPYSPDEDNVIPENAKDTTKGWAWIKDKNRFVKIVIEAETENPNDKKYQEGYFKLTGKNITDNKRNERFFFEDEDLADVFTFSIEEQQKYNQIVENQKLNANKAFEMGNSDEATNEIRKRKNFPLKEGHLIYFQSDGNIAKNLGYVAIPRFQYENSVKDKIDSFFYPIEDAEKLCPTSRIFGFVRDKKFSQKKVNEGKSSYAGRVYFSDAKFDTSKGKVKYDENIVLDILGSPKPTTYEFYLYNPKNLVQNGNYNDSDMRLRGRKFYLHQENKGQYRRKNDLRDSQNSTLKRVLTEGNEFTFSIRFENLEEYELGLLLWSLALENEMAHKVGMGKPLGLGSVSIEVESVEIIDRKASYGTFLTNNNNFFNGQTKNADWETNYISKFTAWIKDVFEKDFEKLENVIALKQILKFSNDFTKPIHYPLCENTDEKQFEWFVANRRSNNPQILPFPKPVNGVASSLRRNRKVR